MRVSAFPLAHSEPCTSLCNCTLSVASTFRFGCVHTSARRAEIRSTLRNAGFVFYETNRTAFLICATCRRSCGLTASPRATTCAACAGRAFKPSVLRRRAEPHRRAVRKRGEPLLPILRSHLRAESIENRAVGLSPPVRHLVMKLPDYGRGRTLSCGEPPQRGSAASPRTATSPPRGLLALPLRTPSLAPLYATAPFRSHLHSDSVASLCATCRRSCGLTASPRATTCVPARA